MIFERHYLIEIKIQFNLLLLLFFSYSFIFPSSNIITEEHKTKLPEKFTTRLDFFILFYAPQRED
jgi:hypothetical protein